MCKAHKLCPQPAFYDCLTPNNKSQMNYDNGNFPYPGYDYLCFHLYKKFFGNEIIAVHYIFPLTLMILSLCIKKVNMSKK